MFFIGFIKINCEEKNLPNNIILYTLLWRGASTPFSLNAGLSFNNGYTTKVLGTNLNHVNFLRLPPLSDLIWRRLRRRIGTDNEDEEREYTEDRSRHR